MAAPDFTNTTEMQAFFLQEVQLGEELIGEGKKFLFFVERFMWRIV